MGVLTSNRKRGADPFSLNFSNSVSFSPFPEFHQPAKKSRLLHSFDEVSDPPRRSSNSSSVLKPSRYPPLIAELKRKPHAPVRPVRNPLTVIENRAQERVAVESQFREADNLAHKMGNWFPKYANARRTALESLRYARKEEKAVEKEVEDKRSKEVRAAGKTVVLLDEDENASEVRAAVDDEVVILDSPPHSTPPAAIRLSTVSLGVDDAENLLKDLQLSQEYRVDDLRVYAKLLLVSKQRDQKLNNLDYEIALQNLELKRHQTLRPQKKEDKKNVEAFKSLTEEENAEVSHAISNACRRKLLVTHESSSISITGELLQCLRPGAWLNDEVINLYMELLKEREKREPQKFLKCHFFNTFFYKKLVSGKGGYNYQSVRRWTTQRKLGYSLYDCDKIFVPIHKEVHWCLAVINVKDKKLQYLDSLGGGGYEDNQVIKAISRYFVDEIKDKNGKEIDLGDWQKELVEDLPQQRNGFDCGVFMIKYADFYSRDIGLCFSQEHMPYFRRRTAKEILKLKAD